MRKLLKYLTLLIYSAIIMIPYLTKNHIYNNIIGYNEPRSDFRDYTALIGTWANGETIINTLYPARIIVGYPMMLINKFSGINMDILYITFYFLGLVATGIAIFFIVSNICNEKAGWLALLISIFCTTGILAMFSYGMIMSILNVYVFLLTAILLAIKWLVNNKKRYLVLSLITFGIFSLFHLTSLYLPYLIGTIMLVVAIVWLVKRVNVTRPIILLLVVMGLNLIISHYSFPQGTDLNKMILTNITVVTSEVVTNGATPIENIIHVSHSPLGITFFIFNYLSVATIGLATLAIIGLIKYRKSISLGKETKLFLIVLASLALILGIGTFSPLAPEPIRAATDFATVLAITIAIGLTLVLKRSPMWYKGIAFMVLALGITNNLTTWIR